MTNQKIRQILCAYRSSQTYTQTVYEHLSSFSTYSKNEWSYVDLSYLNDDLLDFNSFDVIVIHYSIRLPFGQINPKLITKLHRSNVLKVLFIQDEYDNTNFTKRVISQAGIDLVFTVVPLKSISYVYPKHEFPFTRFVNNLTGYVPESLSELVTSLNPPSQRECFIKYRARELPIRYGLLGQEKINIGRDVKAYCRKLGIKNDIDWTEESRIYGLKWYEFISLGRAMLGSESGSNVFDWDGSLQSKIDRFKNKNKKLHDQDVYDSIVKPCEIDGLMNQISPRIFEMAAAKTVMVLYEGKYSDVLIPWRHYLPLKKDLSNIEEIFVILKDGLKIDSMVDQVYEDLILSNKYSYRQFVFKVDAEIEKSSQEIESRLSLPLDFRHSRSKVGVTILSYKNELNKLSVRKAPIQVVLSFRGKFYTRLIYSIWQYLPSPVKKIVKKILRRY